MKLNKNIMLFILMVIQLSNLVIKGENIGSAAIMDSMLNVIQSGNL